MLKGESYKYVLFVKQNIEQDRKLIIKNAHYCKRNLTDSEIKQLEQMEYIINFCNYLLRQDFDKRFLYLMFSTDMSLTTDVKGFIDDFLNQLSCARKNFPKKEE